MKYKVDDWVYINYNGDKPPFPYKVIEANDKNITITVHKKYKSITGWGNTTNSWIVGVEDVIRKCNKGLELE